MTATLAAAARSCRWALAAIEATAGPPRQRKDCYEVLRSNRSCFGTEWSGHAGNHGAGILSMSCHVNVNDGTALGFWGVLAVIRRLM